MGSNNQHDDVVIHDSAERRRFMRRGAAFVAIASGVAMSSSRQALASDCDRGGPGGDKPEHGGNGSDSDTGANADPTGCGRHQSEQPKISRRAPESLPATEKSVSVAKVIA